MGKRIVIVGPAASGKDFLRKRLRSLGLESGVLMTSRPPRDGEVNGEDYCFKSPEFIRSRIESGYTVCHHEYNGWLYALDFAEWDLKDVFVLTPEYLSQMGGLRGEFAVVYLRPSGVSRFLRLLKRGGADGVLRRMKADRRQFRGFRDYDIMITNNDF